MHLYRLSFHPLVAFTKCKVSRERLNNFNENKQIQKTVLFSYFIENRFLSPHIQYPDHSFRSFHPSCLHFISIPTWIQPLSVSNKQLENKLPTENNKLKQKCNKIKKHTVKGQNKTKRRRKRTLPQKSH